MILNTWVCKDWTRHSPITKRFSINRSNWNGISKGLSWQQVLACKCITNKWRLSSTINESMSMDWCLIWNFKGNWDNGMRGNRWRWTGIGTGIEWDGNRCLGQLHDVGHLSLQIHVFWIGAGTRTQRGGRCNGSDWWLAFLGRAFFHLVTGAFTIKAQIQFLVVGFLGRG